MKGSNMGKTVIYTVITNEYDNLRPPNGISAREIGEFEWICFADRPYECWPWKVLPFPQAFKDAKAGRHNSRIPKMLPHLLLDLVETSIYIDGAFRFQEHPNKIIRHIPSGGIAMYLHPAHASIHDERNFYQNLHGFVPEDVEAQYQKYIAEELPCSAPFFAGGVVARRHCLHVTDFNELWMREYVAGSENDQLALYAAIQKSGVPTGVIPGHVTMDSKIGYCLHANSGCGDNPGYAESNAIWQSKRSRIAELIAKK